MQTHYDVLVVGAGPAGSSTAERLARDGWRVGLLEEHANVGTPVNCSGILGVEAFDKFDLPADLVRHSLRAVAFHSPSGLRWRFDVPSVLAHAVDRTELDRFLGARAQQNGAELLVSHKVVAVDVRADRVDVEVDRGEALESERVLLSARAVVVATGAGIPLLRKLGFHRVPQTLLGVQAELTLPAEEVEVYLGRKWAPEGFAWIVPLSKTLSKVGLLCQSNGPRTLRRFLDRPDVRARIKGDVGPIACSVLPLGFLPKSYADRLIVVGEAAGHIKATTCGGIYYGMLTGELAAEVLHSRLCDDRLGAQDLATYETRWRALLESEIRLGLRLRQCLRHTGDWGVDRLMSLARREGIARLIREKANFDWHRDLIESVLRDVTVGKILGVA